MKWLPYWRASSFLLPLLSILLLFYSNLSYSQIDATHCAFDKNQDTVTKENVLLVERKIISIPSGQRPDNRIRGLLEYTPPGYDSADINTRYPVIIYFGGALSIGNGDTTQLCDMLQDYALPWRIERGEVPAVTFGGQTYHYVIISPQYSQYAYDSTSIPSKFPSAGAVESVINYVLKHYNIDSSRIYLTGMSSGANMVMEYAASSVARARRIAALATSSLCSINGKFPNSQTAYQNIAAANLPVWAVACTNDALCSYTISENWVNLINSSSPGVPAILTLLNSCKGTKNHDSWSYTYSPDTTFPANQNKNVYNWFIQFQSSAALPVKMKEYSVRFVNRKVEVKWTTLDEKRNASFTIERAGADQHFVPIKTVVGAGTSSAEHQYSYIDENPLSGMSFYRLSQTDDDGKKTYFEIKKVLNNTSKSFKLLVTPNPFSADVSVLINLEKSQKVTFLITDMSGRKISVTSGVYNQGMTEVKLNTARLSRGAYFLRAQGEEFAETQRIIKK
jgi:predicted peptidase